MTDYAELLWPIHADGIALLPGLWDAVIDMGGGIWYEITFDSRGREALQIVVALSSADLAAVAEPAFPPGIGRWEPLQDATPYQTDTMYIAGGTRLRDLPLPIYEVLMETLYECAEANTGA